MNTTHLSCSLLLLTTLLTGCVKKPIYARNDPYVPQQVNLTSEDLRTHTAFGPAVLSRGPGDILYVTIPARAATDKQLYIDYRVTFFDRSGAVLSQSGWISKTLAPNVHDQIQVNSMSPRAVDFQMDVRYTRIN